MELFKIENVVTLLVLFFLLYLRDVQSTSLSDVIRIPRQTKYYNDRYQKASTTSKISTAPLKPEDSPEAREHGDTIVGKRCSRCEYRDSDNYPYDYRDSIYDDRYKDDRYKDDRYKDDRSRDRYQDRYLIDYDRRYNDRDRYFDRSDKERDRYYDRYDDRERDPYTDRRYNYDERPEKYDRYDRDRSYDSRDRGADRYERDRPYYDRSYYDRDSDRDYNRYNDRYYDRYDDRDRGGYRPWDETTRGSSGFDKYGRGYYFATGRPEYSGYEGSGYASKWDYGGRGDDYYRRWKEQGFDPQKPAPPLAGPESQPASTGRDGWYRYRDRDEPGYHRGTSYLYGRPTTPSTSTEKPSSGKGNNATPTEASNSPSTG